MTTEISTERYTVSQTIEYTSFSPTGWSQGQVFRYAPDYEQTRTCPNCSTQVVPAATGDIRPAAAELDWPDTKDEGLLSCPRCLAWCRFPALDPLVYIRNLNNGKPWAKPFTMRESQLREWAASQERARCEAIR